jgi:hypothetical protein
VLLHLTVLLTLAYKPTLNVCEMLESCDSELRTLTDLCDKLIYLVGQDDVYHEKTLQGSLLKDMVTIFSLQLFVVAKMLFPQFGIKNNNR